MKKAGSNRLLDHAVEQYTSKDMVNNPPHYTVGTVECIDAIQASLTIDGFNGYLKGNVIKYMWRYEKKGGIQDLEKAQWYLNKLHNMLNGG